MSLENENNCSKKFKENSSISLTESIDKEKIDNFEFEIIDGNDTINFIIHRYIIYNM